MAGSCRFLLFQLAFTMNNGLMMMMITDLSPKNYCFGPENFSLKSQINDLQLNGIWGEFFFQYC